MRQNEVRATEPTTPPAGRQGNQAVTKATRYPEGGTSEKTGPGRHKGPTAGGREASIGRGGEPTTAKQTTEKRRPNHPQKGHDDHGQTPIAAQAETPTQRNHRPKRGHAREKAKHKTKDNGRQGEHSPDQTAPNQPTRQNKKGGHEGTEPHGGTQKDPHHTAASGSKPQCGAQGKRAQEIKWQNDNITEGRGEGRGGSLRQTPCSIFKVVLFICSKSVIPAVPNRKGDRVSSLFPCGKKPQFIAFGLKGNPVSLLRFPT